MDCYKFNELLIDFEAKKLPESLEEEFIQHKNNCSCCNSVYQLIFEVEDINNYEYETYVNDEYITAKVMEKIQNIDIDGYNFKFKNSIHIFFGGILMWFIYKVFINTGGFVIGAINLILGVVYEITQLIYNTFDFIALATSTYFNGIIVTFFIIALLFSIKKSIEDKL